MRLVEDVEAGDDRLAFRRRHVAGQDAHGRRLAGAVRAEKAENLAALDAEVQVVDRGDAAVALGEVLNLNQRAILHEFDRCKLLKAAATVPPTPILIERPRERQEAGRFCCGLLLPLPGSGWWWTHRSIPPLDGRIPLAGLQSPVEVRFDALRRPSCLCRDPTTTPGGRSGTCRHAIVCGRWSSTAARPRAACRSCSARRRLPIDQRFLTLGLRRAAEREWTRTPPDVRPAFERYAAGVNAGASAVARPGLPIELSCCASRRSRGRRSIRWRSASCSRGGSGRTIGRSCCGTRSPRELGPRALELFPDRPNGRR